MGAALELINDANTDHYSAKRGRALLFGGGPVVEGDGSLVADGATSRVFADLNHRISEAGTIKAWSFFQANAVVGDLPMLIGTAKLVIVYEDGGDYKIRAVAEMTRDITKAGVWEFPCEITVQRNDIVAIWLEAAADVEVSQQADPDTLASTLLRFDETDPVAGDTLGTVTVQSGQVRSLAVRGDVVESTIADISTLWVAGQLSTPGDDAFAYLQFTLSSNAWEEGNILTGSNLFDNLKATTASVATGTTTLNNIYYFINPGATTGLKPVERFIIHGAVPAAGGEIRVYGSANVAEANNLAGAQAITAGEWDLLLTIDENTPAARITDMMYQVGKLYQWMRVELVGATAAATTLAAFEVQIMDTKETDSTFAPNGVGAGALKDRCFVDKDTHAEAEYMPAVITQDLGSTDVTVLVENAPAAFFDQLTVGGYAYLRHNLPRGSKNMMVRAQIKSINPGGTAVTFEAGAGELFQVGEFLLPEVWFYRFFAHDSGGGIFAASNWIGPHSATEDWIRAHDVFTTPGN